MTDHLPPPPPPADASRDAWAHLPPPPPAAATWGVPAPAVRRHRPERVSVLWWFTAPVLAVLVGSLVIVLAMPVPYVQLSRGSARSVEPLVTVRPVADGPGFDDEPPSDDLLFVTVSVRRPSGIEALYQLLDDTVTVVPEKQVNGTQSREETRQFNLQLMTDSKDKAAKVALERLGYDVPYTTTGAVITDLDPSFPADEVLNPGETVVEADGKPVTDVEQLKTAILAHAPGETIALRVQPFGETATREVVAELGARPDDATVPLLGVTLQDRPKYTFPVEVLIDSGDVGGPSAGLAFTLAIVDRLTPGSLTGGQRVAVTGTIEVDGSVGPVGGVIQKTEAAVHEGAKLFIVPPDEFEDAKQAARGRLEVEQASSLDEALAILRDFGGEPVPDAPPTTEPGSGG